MVLKSVDTDLEIANLDQLRSNADSTIANTADMELKEVTKKTAAQNGIRSMRTKGVEPKTGDFAGVLRVEYEPLIGIKIGGSAYMGGADHSDDEDKQISVGLYEGDIRIKKMGLDIQGQFAYGTLSGTYFTKTLGSANKNFTGFMGEAGYHLAGLLCDKSDLVPFARFEMIDTDAKDSNAKTGYTLITIGAAYLPAPKISIKADINLWSHDKEGKYTFNDGTKDSKKTELNTGMGYMF
ncbi:MAG: hypothetical protein ABIA63_14825 [bacterium]